MAPVARGIADREKDGLVLPEGTGERLITPRVPVYGIRCMLEKVGTFFMYQPVIMDPGGVM
jgi:hypothetical protein